MIRGRKMSEMNKDEKEGKRKEEGEEGRGGMRGKQLTECSLLYGCYKESLSAEERLPVHC